MSPCTLVFSTPLAAIQVMWRAVTLSPHRYNCSNWRSWVFPELKPATESYRLSGYMVPSSETSVPSSETSPFLRDLCELEIERFKLKTQLHAKESWWMNISAPHLLSSLCQEEAPLLFLTPPRFLSNAHFCCSFKEVRKSRRAKIWTWK